MKVKVALSAGPMVVGYQNLLTLVSLKLVYNPPLLNLTGLKKKKKKKDRPGGEERLGQELIQILRFPTTSGCLSTYGQCVSGLTSRLLLPLWAAVPCGYTGVFSSSSVNSAHFSCNAE